MSNDILVWGLSCLYSLILKMAQEFEKPKFYLKFIFLVFYVKLSIKLS